MSGIKNAEVAWLLLFLLYMEAPARVILSGGIFRSELRNDEVEPEGREP